MSNSDYIGLWKTNFGDNILQIYKGPKSKLMWKWIKWRGSTVVQGDHMYGGDCLKWRPHKKDGYTKIHMFKDYLKRL